VRHGRDQLHHARLRTLGNDTATSNPKFSDTPTGLRNAANALFRLSYPNPVPASMYLTYGAGIIRQPAGAGTFSLLDGPSGYVTMLGAAIPDASVTQPFFFDYFYQWFQDADYTTMLDNATDVIGPPLGISAGTDLPEGLYPAQLQYALSDYWNRRASQFANLFATKASTSESAPETPSLNFGKLAAAAQKSADKLLLAYYTKSGANKTPASGTVSYQFSKVTPRT
jgi:hypothetical protein